MFNFIHDVFLKRLLANFFDILFPTIFSIISYYIVFLSSKKGFLISFVPVYLYMWFFYFITLIFTILVTKGRTLGEIILKIKLVSVKEEEINLIRILLCKVYFAFVLLGLLVFPNGWIGLLLNIIPLGKFKGWDHVVIPLDLIFRLKYINNS